jgi:hypothetical protein
MQTPKTPEQLNAFINAELGNWSENVRTLLMENVKKKGLTLSSSLLNSFDQQVQEATQGTLAKVFFVFSDHGRHHDMRSLVYTKMPPVGELEEFVRKVGLSKFKYVPGYERGRMPAESIAIKRIAWGIAQSRLKSYKHKPRKWFAKSFYGQINILISSLLEGYQESLVGQVKTELT